MAALTAAQISQLNNMNRAAQKGTLGTRVNAHDVAMTATNAEAKAETLATKALTLANLRQGGATAPANSVVEAMFVQHYQFAPANASATGVHAAITLSTATQAITADITNPDFPRLVCIVSNNAITTKVTIVGTDIAGGALSEELTLNGTTPVNSTNAFKTVTSINCPIRTNSGDTVSVGTVNTFGMPHVVPYAGGLLVKYFNGSTDTGTLTVSATLAKNLFALNGTPDGAKKVDLFYLV